MNNDNDARDSIKHLPYVIDEKKRHHFYENNWKRVGLKLLSRYYPLQGRTFLDYGCGRGEALKIFAEAGMEVTGVDTDPECIKLAAQFGKTSLITEAQPFINLPEKSFDTVGCFHVLEHVENPKQVLTQLGRIAREYVIVAVPNLNRLNGIFARGKSVLQVNEGHLQSWDHAHFFNLAERHCGLQLVAWGHDAVILSGVSWGINHFLGSKTAIWAETGIFTKIFPFHCISVLALLKPKK